MVVEHPQIVLRGRVSSFRGGLELIQRRRIVAIQKGLPTALDIGTGWSRERYEQREKAGFEGCPHGRLRQVLSPI